MKLYHWLLSLLILAMSFQAFSLEKQTSTHFEKQAFTKELFDKYQSEGVVTLIDVFAKWCPTCAKQQEVLNAYFQENPTSKIKVLVVDYDTQKEWVKYFEAPRQSSLYIYAKGKKEWFSVAETRKNEIFALLKKWETP
ncbi:thioredoxin family protein [Candidatus Sororendozoicomonas aggregata]|uniref:thioredoxin family protein n=1 Tax=Candidatus Sororendozoicomonas aggregata TaxID=3073239 RepID=UPI002ED456AC